MVQANKRLLIVAGNKPSPGGFIKELNEKFMVLFASEIGSIRNAFEKSKDIKALIVIEANLDNPYQLCTEASEFKKDLPIILLLKQDNTKNHLKAFKAGCDDVMAQNMGSQEILMRIDKAIFNQIANNQLQDQVKFANDIASSAIANTSDLGVNVQFLIDTYTCENLDELGQLFFQAIKHYKVTCSLQMRSIFAYKNMEQNGLAKDLESHLLLEFKDQGPCVNFDKRVILNLGQISVLIKNMPIKEPGRCESTKENIFTLIKGIDARVKTLDDKQSVELEKDLIRKLSTRMNNVMQTVDDDYQDVVKKCAELVENMSIHVDKSIIYLDLTEEQETTLHDIMSVGVSEINALFNDGLKLDNQFKSLVTNMEKLFDGDCNINQVQQLVSRL